MYYQNYEDYMRSILGYPAQTQGNFNTYNSFENEYVVQAPSSNTEIMSLYPEIYKLLNPMVCKICEANTKPITRELIEKMTDEIYSNIESDPGNENSEIVNVRVNLSNSQGTSSSSSNIPRTNTQSSALRTKIEETRSNKKINSFSNTSVRERGAISENTREKNNNGNDTRAETENRQFGRRNNLLRDLIKILILNRLLGGNVRPPRPNPPRPPRPPFPGGPGRPGGGGGNNPNPPMPPRPRGLIESDYSYYI